MGEARIRGAMVSGCTQCCGDADMVGLSRKAQNIYYKLRISLFIWAGDRITIGECNSRLGSFWTKVTM